MELGALWWPLFLLALISAALYGVFWLVFRDGPKAAVLAALVTIWFHFYGDYNWALWVWTLLFVGARLPRRRCSGTPRFLGAVALGLAIWAIVLVVSPAIDIVRYEIRQPRPVELGPEGVADEARDSDRAERRAAGRTSTS